MVDRPSLAPSQPFGGFGEDAGLDLPPLSLRVEQQIIDRQLDDVTLEIVAIGPRDEHAIYRAAAQRLTP